MECLRIDSQDNEHSFNEQKAKASEKSFSAFGSGSFRIYMAFKYCLTILIHKPWVYISVNEPNSQPC